MTNQEAAQYFARKRDTLIWGLKDNRDETRQAHDAYNVAISALTEVGSPTTQTDAQHAKNLMSGALAGTDAADRLRWLLAQAERVVTVDAEDRRAVERACQLLKQIDNGFDAVRT